MRESVKKTLKTLKHNLARIFKHMTIFWDSNYFNNIYQIVLCAMFRGKQTIFEPLYARTCKNRLKTSETQLST